MVTDVAEEVRTEHRADAGGEAAETERSRGTRESRMPKATWQGEAADRSSVVAATRFMDVRRVAETGSTNADVLELARQGEREGIVVVADHQLAGRGRAGGAWEAPPGSSLLVSVLLRPPVAVADAVTMAVAVAAAEAVEEVAGFTAGLKWPNDLVVSGPDGTHRKLAGVLAGAEWPASSDIGGGAAAPRPGGRAVVAVGMGLNVNWPADLPHGLVVVAVAANHVAGRAVGRDALLVAFLAALDRHYGALAAPDGREAVRTRWRDRSATIGRRVRVELPGHDVVGTAADVTHDGHLVVAPLEGGDHQVFAVGDVTHLRYPTV